MIDWGVSVVKGLDAYFTSLGAQEAAIIGLLIVSLVSLCLLFVLLRRRSKNTVAQPAVSAVEPSEVSAQGASELAAVQSELRELVREFSSVAEQVLRALDRDQVMARLPDAGGAAMQLLDLGLTPTEAARVTGMAGGEVTLLMKLHRMKAMKGGLAATPPTDAGNVPHHVQDGNGRSGHQDIEGAGT
jgi:hypothetical protein